MHIGAIFPHFEFGSDPADVAAYARAAEALGFAHIGADDHVVGPNPVRPGGYTGWTTFNTAFLEPFSLFSFMAPLTSHIEFATCVLILPQRQAVLVAKQSATLDVLSGGRLRLGIGNGWSEIEYEALGMDFHNRGRRIEEQVTLLRRLWSEEHVDFHGAYHRLPDAGINPRPAMGTIPVWFGGESEPVIRRIARIGDGWMPLYPTPEQAASGLRLLDACLAEAGRSRLEVGLEARIPYASGDPGRWRELSAGWREAGATHASLVATDAGLHGAAEHIYALEQFARGVELA